MAKEKLITRTITTTQAEVMSVDVETADVKIKTYTIVGEFENNTAILNACKKQFETEQLKLVNVQDSTVIETLYGMPESKFIELAEKLPPRKNYEAKSEG